jgi:hypothetical protein
MRRNLAASFLLAGAASLCWASPAMDLRVQGDGPGSPLRLSYDFAMPDQELITPTARCSLSSIWKERA